MDRGNYNICFLCCKITLFNFSICEEMFMSYSHWHANLILKGNADKISWNYVLADGKLDIGIHRSLIVKPVIIVNTFNCKEFYFKNMIIYFGRKHRK